AKTVNEKVQLQALVDGKNVIITESTIRRDLHLEDAEGVDCLPNATIFEQLTLMGAKTTSWNEFSSTMASAIICLATNQKFNFSKYIFKSMVKNLENVSGKFLMYPRNMKKVGKGFSGRETPLFLTMMVQAQEEIDEGLAMPTDPYHTPTIIQPSTSQPQKTHKPRRPRRKVTEVPQSSGPTINVADEAVNEEIDDSLERAATTATSLDAEQDRGNINKNQSKATLNEPSSIGTSSGSGPKSQDTMGDTISQTRSENVSKLSNDPLLARGNTLQSGEDSLKLKELMELCTNLQNRVIDLEKTKTSQAQEITSLKRRARVASSSEESLGEEDASKQGRKIDDIDADEGVTLVDKTSKNQGRFNDEEMFDAGVLDGKEVFANVEQEVVAVKEVPVEEVEKVFSTAEVTTAGIEVTTEVTTASIEVTTASATTTTVDDLTLAQTLMEIRSARPKVKGVMIQEQSESTTTRPQQQPSKDKGKGIMVEPEKPTKRKVQISTRARRARKVDYGREVKIVSTTLRDKKETFCSKEKRNKPPTKAQQRSIMCTYLENMEGYTPKNLKSKSFDAIQKLFDRAYKRVNTFEDFRTELVEGNKKRAREELMQESAKKQKVYNDTEEAELKYCLEIIPDEEEIT
ncbi:hypothetical protein Tco_1442744, partial [Tanacetum coccineum]